MKKIVINNTEYEVINNEKDAIDIEVLTEKITDYYDAFDYIVGDYAYGKVRLKGFNDKSNKNFNKVNDISTYNKYIEELCSYKAKHFLLKKVNK